MSMDNFVECSSCKAHTAAALWVRLYGSIDAAEMTGGGMDLFGALMPGPVVMKVEVCFSCKRFAPSTDYTEEEQKRLQKRNEEQKSKVESANKIGDLLGGIFGKKEKGP